MRMSAERRFYNQSTAPPSNDNLMEPDRPMADALTSSFPTRVTGLLSIILVMPRQDRRVRSARVTYYSEKSVADIFQLLASTV